MLGCPAQVRGEVGAPGSITIEGVGVTAAHAGEADRDVRPLRAPTNRGSVPATVRKARAADGPAIQTLLAHFASRGELLHRTLNEVYQHLRDFVVGEVDGRVVGVCALWLYWEDLAEVRSLAVAEEQGGKGIGRQLVQACLDEARQLALKRVFALTYKPGFFEKLGFHTIEKSELPHKIWGDCMKCAKFPECDEIAMSIELQAD